MLLKITLSNMFKELRTGLSCDRNDSEQTPLGRLLTTNMNNSFSDKYHRPYLMGISIIIICIYHFWMFAKIYDNNEISVAGDFFGYGYLGVDIFFFLSTYGLSYSINNNSLKQFYKNRFSRIIPVYVVFLVICISTFINDGYLNNARYFLSSLLGLSVIAGFPQVEWYTPSLILIYACFPIINVISKWIASKNYIITSFLLVFTFILLYKVNIPIYANLYHRLPIIFLGCIYYYLEKKNDERAMSILSILALFGICCSYGCFDRISLAIPAILFVVGKTKAMPLYKPISFCGKWSFEIYLAQVISTKFFMKIYDGNVVLEALYVSLITLILAFLLSLVSYYCKIAFKTRQIQELNKTAPGTQLQ